MKFKLKIKDEYYNLIKRGLKKYEVRLANKCRDIIIPGDELILHNESTHQENNVKVEEVKKFHDLDHMLNVLSPHDIGFDGKTKQEIKQTFLTFYKDEDIKKYGLVGLKIN